MIRSARWQDAGRGGTVYYPIWLSYATGLIYEEHETKLVDAPTWGWTVQDVVNDIINFKPDLIVMDCSFPTLNYDLSVAGYIKNSYRDAKIVMVGPPASQFDLKILENENVDIVARWEYEFTVKELVEAMERESALEDILGISYKNNNHIVRNPDRGFTSSEELNRIPFVSKVYDRYLRIEDYFLGTSLYPEVQIFAGKGCPNNCTFCSWPQTLMGKKYRIRDVDNLIEEFRWIHENLPQVKEVFIDDDTFTINKNYVRRFCEGLAAERFDLVWSCNVRANLDYQTMKIMKDSKCRLVIVGYESGSDLILKNIKKGIATEESKRFSKDAKKAGLLVLGDFVVGFPGESKESIIKTKKFIQELKPELLQVAPATPFPGTEFYDYCKNNNYLVTEDPNEYLDETGHQRSVVRYPNLSEDDIVKAVDDILKDYYLSYNYIPLAIKQVLRRNGYNELRRFMHSTKIFLKYISDR